MANPQSKQLAIDVIARVDKLEKAMTKAAGVTDRNMGKVERRTKTMVSRVDKQFSGLAKSIGGVGKAFIGGLAGGMFIGGLEGLSRGVRSVVSELAGIANVSKMVGIATDDLQRLRYGFETTGVAADQTDTALRRFARRVGEAANGGGVLHDVLKANNVQLRNSDGSMRSQIDLLRDYANLIKNAGSHQDRLTLAFKAFDVAGAEMVQALENGSDGLSKLMGETEKAGGVISQHLIDRATELDTKWAATWRNFEINAKSAIMHAVDAMAGLRGMFDDYEKRLKGAEAGRMVGAMVRPKGSVLTTGTQGKPTPLDARMAGTLAMELSEADQKLVEALKKRYGAAAEKATIIPQGKGGKGSGSSRDAAAEKALREAEAVQRLIDNLTEELRLVGASEVARAKSNALRQAGAAATTEQKAEIERLVEAIYSENEALEKTKQAMEELRDTAHDAIGGFIQDMLDGKSATEALSNTLKQLASQLINSGLNSLMAGIFGGGAGGGINYGALSASGKYLFASGGYTGPGPKNKIAGAVHAGEVVWSQDDVRKAGGVAAVEAMRKGAGTMGSVAMPAAMRAPVMPAMPAGGGGGTSNVNISMPINIDAKGADRDGLMRVEQQVAKLRQEVPSMIVQKVREMPQKNIR